MWILLSLSQRKIHLKRNIPHTFKMVFAHITNNTDNIVLEITETKSHTISDQFFLKLFFNSNICILSIENLIRKKSEKFIRKYLRCVCVYGNLTVSCRLSMMAAPLYQLLFLNSQWKLCTVFEIVGLVLG